MSIRVYVQELGSYNMGLSVGKWIEVSEFDTQLEKLFEEAVLAITGLSLVGNFVPVAEEYEIVDYETDYDINLDSIYQDIEQMKYMDTLLSNATDYEIKVISYMLDNGYDIKQINSDSIYEVYMYDNWDEAVEDFIEVFLDVPEDSKVHSYIDYDKVQRDLEYEGYCEVGGSVFRDWN